VPACLCLLYFWKSKVKCGALSHSGFGPDSPAMAGYNALHIRKSNACAFKFGLRMETLEYTEEFIRIFHIKSCAVVFDKKDKFFLVLFISNPDFSTGTDTRIFNRIRNKISKHQAQHRLVAIYVRQRIDIPYNVPPFRFMLNIADNSFNQSVKTYFPLSHLYTRD